MKHLSKEEIAGRKEIILKRLRELAATSEKQDTWVIEFEGKRLTLHSGKGSWKSLMAAKCALRNNFYGTFSLQGSNNKDNLRVVKQLESEGIIKYVKL